MVSHHRGIKQSHKRSESVSKVVTLFVAAEHSMRFNQREWITDIASGTIAGLSAAVVATLILPDAPFLATLAAGGLIGFIRAAANLPLKWVFDLRPGSRDDSDGSAPDEDLS